MEKGLELLMGPSKGHDWENVEVQWDQKLKSGELWRMWLEREVWMGTCRLNVLPGSSVLGAAGIPGRSVHGNDLFRCVFGVSRRPSGRGLEGTGSEVRRALGDRGT